MRKLLLTSALALLTILGIGQSLQKGNVIRIGEATIELNPGVTMEQWTDFLIKRTIPEIEKNYNGWKLYPMKGIMGECENIIGVIYIIESTDYFYKYYNEDGSITEAGQAAAKKLQPLIEERTEKLGTLTLRNNYWVIL